MKVSLNTVKQYINFELPPVDELVARINAQLGGVEEVTDLGVKYKDAVIVKVVSAEQHPDADRLRVCWVDDGGVVADAPRDDRGYVQVVCGAPNAREGIFAVWLPPKSTVPASFDDVEPFVLDARPLRGVLSQGMLAAGDELAINSDHNGIIEIDPSEWKPGDVEIKPGQSFAKAYGLDDTIIDIENKMFTHRPDCFGQLGVAREIAGIFDQPFTSPSWYLAAPDFGGGEGLTLDVFNDAPEKVPRFMAVALKNVTVKPSPLWLQCELVRLGSKSINNIVDVTNYIMLLTAQPVHAYDYDKIRGQKLGARMAHAGETALLLNGKTYELGEDDIVIADGEGVIGLAGIMGGGNSEVSTDTKRIVLEVATFDMYAVRKSSMRHGVFTDALTRFNKGQSPLQNDHILHLLMMSVRDVAGGAQASEVVDLREKMVDESYLDEIDVRFVNDRLGVKLNGEEMYRLLHNVEFGGHFRQSINPAGVVEAEYLSLSVPFWRTDIEQPEDIVEEVGRLYGFDKLPRELPQRSAKPAAENALRTLKQTVRESLARAGANEVLTYSFVHENVIKKAEQNSADAYRLSNALSPDLQYYRLSLTPSLLDKVHGNSKAGYGEFALFEIGKAHSKAAPADAEGLPPEFERIALTYAAKQASGTPYYQAKELLDYLAARLGLTLVYRPLGDEDVALAAPFEPKRSATVMTALGEILGVVGEYKASVARAFKLPTAAAGFEIATDVLLASAQHAQGGYRPLSRYPGTERDMCFQVAPEVTYAAVETAAREAAHATDLAVTIEPLDIYQPDNGTYKNITLRFGIVSHDRTLEGDEVSATMQQIAERVGEQTAARVV